MHVVTHMGPSYLIHENNTYLSTETMQIDQDYWKKTIDDKKKSRYNYRKSFEFRCAHKFWWMVFCYQNCSDLLWEKKNVLVIEKIFWNSWPSASNFKFFSRSLAQFFLTVGQNNFDNKIPFISFYDKNSHWKVTKWWKTEI